MLETIGTVLSYLDGAAGFAALVNGALLWPIVKTLKADHARAKAETNARLDNHEGRLTKGGL